MMKNGLCPKCSSTNIFRGLSADGEGLTAGSYILLVEVTAGRSLNTLWIETYVCQGCGYLEMYGVNQEALIALSTAEGWTRVPCQNEVGQGGGQAIEPTHSERAS